MRPFKPRRRVEEDFQKMLRESEIPDVENPVEVPDLDNDDLIEANSLSLVVQLLNPGVQKVSGAVLGLPRIWEMEERVRGRGIGVDRVQFSFKEEADLQSVLRRGPWFLTGWMVSIARWSPSLSPEDLSKICFWVRFRGIPLHLLKDESIKSACHGWGEVEQIILHAKQSDSVEHVRARVWLNTENPLPFKRALKFRSGETVIVEMEYEKLSKCCFLCRRLTHEKDVCPFRLRSESVGDSKGTKQRSGDEVHSPAGPRGSGSQDLRHRLQQSRSASKVSLGPENLQDVSIDYIDKAPQATLLSRAVREKLAARLPRDAVSHADVVCSSSVAVKGDPRKRAKSDPIYAPVAKRLSFPAKEKQSNRRWKKKRMQSAIVAGNQEESESSLVSIQSPSKKRKCDEGSEYPIKRSRFDRGGKDSSDEDEVLLSHTAGSPRSAPPPVISAGYSGSKYVSSAPVATNPPKS
ncbi:hypothetical protein EUTSA_v10001223mg, partial [Eutrema salsugineum]